VEHFGESQVRLKRKFASSKEMQTHLKARVLEQETIQISLELIGKSTAEVANELESRLGLTWKPASKTRNANGLRRFANWATGRKVRTRKKS
jgi:uncharacterized protein with HEPN domain